MGRHHFLMGDAKLQTMAAGQGKFLGFLANLTKVRLEMGSIWNSELYDPQDGLLAPLLSHAQDFEHLFFELSFDHSGLDPNSELSTFRLSLGGCQFPKLKTLALVNIETKGDEMLQFMLDSPELKYVVLYRSRLAGYLWHDFLEAVKAEMQLEALHMSTIWEGFRNADYQLKHYNHYHGEVSRFLLGNGPNPFGGESLHVPKNGIFTSGAQVPHLDQKMGDYLDLYFM